MTFVSVDSIGWIAGNAKAGTGNDVVCGVINKTMTPKIKVIYLWRAHFNNPRIFSCQALVADSTCQQIHWGCSNP